MYFSLAIILFVLISIFMLTKWLNHSNPDYVIKMLQKIEGKSAFVFNENGERKINIRSSEMLGLASTVKIMVALEYAYQVMEGKITGEESISLNELEKFYLPRLDGGAHAAWLKNAEEKGKIKNGMVSLRDIARGMLEYSSNANTEYLMEKLGIENIEARSRQAGVKDHSSLYYFVSTIFIPFEIKNNEFPKMDMKGAKNRIIERIRGLSYEDWVTLSTEIHLKLTSSNLYKMEANVLGWWNSEYDRIYSERFTQSTASEYVALMRRLNNKEFPIEVQEEMEFLLGSIMDNPLNQVWLQRAGKKGGSTLYILTDALFVEDKKGNKFEIAIFFNGLNWYESRKLMSCLNEFERKLISEQSYREKVYNALKLN